MNWKPWFALLAACCVVTGCAVSRAVGAEEPPVVYRHRFIGAENVADLAVKPRAHALLSTTNALAFRQVAATRFARWTAQAVGAPPEKSTGIATALELGLVADSAVEIRGGTSGWTALFAAHLAADEGDRFIQQVKQAATDLGLQSASAKVHLTALRDGTWVVAAFGSGKAPAEAAIKSRLAALAKVSADPKGAAGTNAPLLSVEADLPALAKLCQWPALPVKLGRVELAVAAQGEFLKTSGTVALTEKSAWPKAKWNVPTNLVHDPLVSFTALRAPGPIFSADTVLGAFLGANLASSQAYLWTQSEVPFQTYFALASADPAKEVARIASTMPPRINPLLGGTETSQMAWNSNKTAVQISGLSLVMPQVTATNDPTGSWLTGGLIAPLPHRNTQPAPEGLLQQFTGRDDVVLYDWEISQERVGYWRVLSQLAPAIGQGTSLKTPAEVRVPFSTTERFLQSTGEGLGNTITELTLGKDGKLGFNRKSHLGLTGFELVHLARWLADSPASIAAVRKAAPAPAFPGNP